MKHAVYGSAADAVFAGDLTDAAAVLPVPADDYRRYPERVHRNGLRFVDGVQGRHRCCAYKVEVGVCESIHSELAT
jgi:hypothetical protein